MIFKKQDPTTLVNRRLTPHYVLVDVQPGQKTKFTLNRFRPWSAEPFGTVELFSTDK